MLGGHFHGHFGYSKSVVDIEVDLRLGADFILYWQPVKYLGEAYAEFHLKGAIRIEKAFITVSKSISMDASAKISIWGPDFSGHAELELHFIVSFSVDVDFGAASKEIEAIDWDTFKEKLLPPADKVVSLSLVSGINQESGESELPTVNPLETRLILDSQIPVQKEGVRLGIKPVGLTGQSFRSPVEFVISHDGATVANDEIFNCSPVHKNVPSALWQPATENGKIPKEKAAELIEDVICGYELNAKRPTLTNGIEILTSSVDDVLEGKVEAISDQREYVLVELSDLGEELLQAFQTA
jgi:hypothetical protein